jgi:hypothetical protein
MRRKSGMVDDRFDYLTLCKRNLEGYVSDLRGSGVNESAISGLVDGFLDQPAYYPQFRAAMKREVLGYE